MPLPARRNSLSVMDTYYRDEDEFADAAAQPAAYAPHQHQHRTMPQGPPPPGYAAPYTMPPGPPPAYYGWDALGAAAPHPHPQPVGDAISTAASSSRKTNRTTSTSSTASRFTSYSTDSTFTSGYFLNDGPRHKTSPSACFAPKSAAARLPPPGVYAVRQARREETTPGPGNYSPVYCVQGRPSPYA